MQASIILSLTTEKVCEQHKVAEMICLGKGTVSKVVKQLEADGYIQIERRRKDKRIRVLRPTHKAYYLSQQIQGLHHMMEEILLGDYLAGISEHLEHYLREMMKNVPCMTILQTVFMHYITGRFKCKTFWRDMRGYKFTYPNSTSVTSMTQKPASRA